MNETLTDDLRKRLRDPEYVKLYGAALAKAQLAITLALAREKAGMKQKELADKLGFSQPYIAKLEGGDANPTIGTVGSLLAVLGFQLATDVRPLLPPMEVSPPAFTVDVAGFEPGELGGGVALYWGQELGPVSWRSVETPLSSGGTASASHIPVQRRASPVGAAG